jgi:hypothetical protein
MEIMFKLLLNIGFLFMGSLFILTSYKDKKQNYYPKWFRIFIFIIGIWHILVSFTAWL